MHFLPCIIPFLVQSLSFFIKIKKNVFKSYKNIIKEMFNKVLFQENLAYSVIFMA